LQTRVDGLVYAYRTLGHTLASTNPLAKQRPENELLSLRELGFSEKDLDLTVSSKYLLGGAAMPLREMRAKLEEIYCGNIGFEFMHIAHARVRNWLRERIETRAQWPIDAKTKKRVKKGAPGAKQVREKSRIWYARGIKGREKENVPLASNAEAADREMARLQREAEQGHAGVPDKKAERTVEKISKPGGKHSD
jgi:hypothetical protein